MHIFLIIFSLLYRSGNTCTDTYIRQIKRKKITRSEGQLATSTNCIYAKTIIIHSHTCYYSERTIADIIKWCSNPEVSSIGCSCISDNKCTIRYIPSSMSGEVDTFPILIYHYCGTVTLYESIPQYIIICYVTISCIQYTSEHCSSSFTYSNIIWLTDYCR